MLYIVYELAIVGENNLSIIWDGILFSDAMWLAVLWILWVVAAGLTIKRKNQLLGGFSCSVLGEFCKHPFWLSIHLLNTHVSVASVAEQKCNELVAAEGIEIVTFVLCMCFVSSTCHLS